MERILLSIPGKDFNVEGILLKELPDSLLIYSQNRLCLASKDGVITEVIVDYCLCPNVDLEWEP